MTRGELLDALVAERYAPPPLPRAVPPYPVERALAARRAQPPAGQVRPVYGRRRRHLVVVDGGDRAAVA